MISIFKNNKTSWHIMCSFTMCIFGGYLYYAAQITTKQFITIDDRFAVDLNEQIKILLNETINQNHDRRFTTLKSQFPIIELLKVQRTSLNKNHVQVVASNPIYRLGEKFVLTNTNQIFLTTDFDQQALKALPQIFLHNDPKTVAEIEEAQKLFLQQLPEFVTNQYEIHWHSLNYIVLINKHNSTQHVLVKYDQNLTLALFAAVEKLFAEYQTGTNKKCQEAIKIDLRFEKQIIVSC